MATLLGEPYCLPMRDVVRLTPRQIVGLYHRKQDDKGNLVPLPYAFDDGEAEKEQAVRFWMASGMTEDEAREKIYGQC